MENDDRFKHLASDPKFKVLKRKERKVQIDERFQSMFTDKKFTSSADNLKRFYDIKDDRSKKVTKKSSKKARVKDTDNVEDKNDVTEDEESESEDVEQDSAKATDDEKGEANDEDEEEEEEDGEAEESLSESSDESESEPELDSDGEEVDGDRIQFNWQPLDHDAEHAETASNRLAIQNLDWDKIDVRDLFTLIKSIRMPLNVRIYISEFGKERLAKEEVEGPQELVEMPKEDDEEEEEFRILQERMQLIKNVGPKTYKVNEYEDADEIADMKNEELRERVRRYQLNRMKYYYAIAEFDSIESAELVYKELDGLEYEGSSIELDLRFVPDDIEFDSADIKAECDQVPDLSSYKAPMFINSALQQTTVNFTWDQTDVKRQEKLHRAFTKEEMEKDDLDAYIGSGSESDDDDDAADDDGENDDMDDETRKNKYRELLQDLDAEEGKKGGVDLEVEWGDNDDEDDEDDEAEDNQDDDEDDEDDDESDDEDEDDDHDEDEDLDDDDQDQDEDDDVMDMKNANLKPSNRKNVRRQITTKKLKDIDDSEDDAKDELDLLMGESKIKNLDDDFKFNPDDDRFKAIYEAPTFNIDPSHPNFKRSKAFDLMAEKKRKKRLKINH